MVKQGVKSGTEEVFPSFDRKYLKTRRKGKKSWEPYSSCHATSTVHYFHLRQTKTIRILFSCMEEKYTPIDVCTARRSNNKSGCAVSSFKKGMCRYIYDVHACAYTNFLIFQSLCSKVLKCVAVNTLLKALLTVLLRTVTSCTLSVFSEEKCLNVANQKRLVNAKRKSTFHSQGINWTFETRFSDTYRPANDEKDGAYVLQHLLIRTTLMHP